MFDIHQQLLDEDSGELHEDQVGQYIDELYRLFAESPEGKAVIEQFGDLGYLGMMLEYAIDYIGVTPATMSRRDFEEVIFELFPKKVSTEPENAPAIIAEMRAFWQFAKRQFGLANADSILASIGPGAEERLRRELDDPSNYGMAKSFFMAGVKAGFDMTTEEGLKAFQAVYNASILSRGMGMPGPVFGSGLFPPLPGFPQHPGGKAKRRKARKAQRQSRKRNRKK